MPSTKNHIISVLLGLNFTSHLPDHAFKYSKSVLIKVCKSSCGMANTSVTVSSTKSTKASHIVCYKCTSFTKL